MPSPAAAAIPASTIYLYPGGITDPRLALAAFALMVVPAVLMVSTIRFNSFKAIDTNQRKSYKVLVLLALVLAVIQLHPSIVLVVLAYTYMASGWSACCGRGCTGVRRRRRRQRKRHGRSPPGSLSTSMRPACSSTLRFAIVRPSPVPTALVEK